MSVITLGWGQLGAIGIALLFVMLERVRLKGWIAAGMEGFRIWGFMAASVLTIWLAFSLTDNVSRIGLALTSPILAGMLVNNGYLAMRRRYDGA